MAACSSTPALPTPTSVSVERALRDPDTGAAVPCPHRHEWVEIEAQRAAAVAGSGEAWTDIGPGAVLEVQCGIGLGETTLDLAALHGVHHGDGGVPAAMPLEGRYLVWLRVTDASGGIVVASPPRERIDLRREPARLVVDVCPDGGHQGFHWALRSRSSAAESDCAGLGVTDIEVRYRALPAGDASWKTVRFPCIHRDPDLSVFADASGNGRLPPLRAGHYEVSATALRGNSEAGRTATEMTVEDRSRLTESTLVISVDE